MCYWQMKTEMLDNLLEIEIAYNMLKADGDKSKDQLDMYYEKLKTDIQVFSSYWNTSELTIDDRFCLTLKLQQFYCSIVCC